MPRAQRPTRGGPAAPSRAPSRAPRCSSARRPGAPRWSTPEGGARRASYREGMAAVSARGLVKTFGEGRAQRRVLDAVDLEVAAGEVVAVLGRSGSGKSTLLH